MADAEDQDRVRLYSVANDVGRDDGQLPATTGYLPSTVRLIGETHCCLAYPLGETLSGAGIEIFDIAGDVSEVRERRS